MIGIIRYNTGNVGSVQRACRRLEIATRIISEPDEMKECRGLILPGAGAAVTAMSALLNKKFIQKLRSWNKPILGICLGMQILFDMSEEGNTECLGIVPGVVRRLPSSLIVPQIGWNTLRSTETSSDSLGFAYFMNSYFCEPCNNDVVTMTVEYGGTRCAAFRQGAVFGVQWHPEKSGNIGDEYLLSFASLCS